MKIIKEEVNFKKREIKEVDPFNEEDWDEFELNNGDLLYFFGIDDLNVIYGVGRVELNGDRFKMYINKCSDNDLANTNVNINDIKTELVKNQYSPCNINIKDGVYITSIVVDKYLNKYYKDIHENVRRSLYENIKNINGKINNIENKLDSLENDVIKFKKNIKNKGEFPTPASLDLKDDEFVVVKSQTVNNEIKIDILISVVSDLDDKGGRYLLNIDDDQKITYIKDRYEKLKENGYLLLKSKNENNRKIYITNNPDIYMAAVDRIIKNTNTEIEEKIEKNRTEYKEKLEDIKKLRKELDDARENYSKFVFSEIFEKLKKMT